MPYFLLFGSAILICIIFLFAYLLFKKTNNAGVVDVIWAGSFFIVALYYALFAKVNLPSIIAFIIPALWSLRLCIYLWIRFLGKPEDVRYANLRREWAELANKKMFWFYQFQALTVFIISLPFFFIFKSAPEFLTWNYYVALIFAVVAIVGEGLADQQLAKHKKNSSAVCRSGLWNYSRHPNYFFEWVHWFAYTAMLCGTDYWYIGLINPVLMYFVLVYMTGVPYTEKLSLAKRGQEYQDYIDSTNMFFPGPPKKS